MRPLLALVLLAPCLFSVPGCEGAPPLPQDAWVWRRLWTPAVSRAVASAPSSLARLRVLAVEHERGAVAVVAVDERALVAAGRPVLATWRVAGSAPPVVDDVEVVLRQIQRWRAVGVDVVGLELDHDCATARLPAYRDLLVEVRRRLPAELRLAVTALPTWADAPVALRALGAVVDELTVQLHAIRAPHLFDPATAVDVAVGFARAAGRDVGVALPTYAARTRDGPLLRVDATELAAVASRLRGAPGIARVAWFRLGAHDDAAAMPTPTLAALAAAAPLRAEVVVETSRAADGALDVSLRNRGNAPGLAPHRIPFPHPSVRAEAAPGVVVAVDAFVIDPAIDPLIVPAGARRRLGWIRPSSAPESP